MLVSIIVAVARRKPASMAEIASANGIKVVLSSVLPVYDYPWKPGLEPAPKIIALNKWMKDYAKQHRAIYLDYHSAMADERGGMRSELASDGVHPTEAGYRVMAPLVEQAIENARKALATANRFLRLLKDVTPEVLDDLTEGVEELQAAIDGFPATQDG